MQGKVSPERSATTPVYVEIDVCKEKTRRPHPSPRPDARIRQLWGNQTIEAFAQGPRGRARGDGGDGQVPPRRPSQPRCRRLRRRRRQSVAFAAVRRGLGRFGQDRPRRLPNAGDPLRKPQARRRGRRRTALLNQLGATTARPAAVEIKRQLRAAETAIENLEAEIEALIGADPRLARRLAILTSIPGVGTVTAIALIAGLAELGSLSAKQAAMIVGLAPIACDSGQSRGRPPHQGRTRPCPPRPLHGRGVRRALQPGAQRPSTTASSQTAKSPKSPSPPSCESSSSSPTPSSAKTAPGSPITLNSRHRCSPEKSDRSNRAGASRPRYTPGESRKGRLAAALAYAARLKRSDRKRTNFRVADGTPHSPDHAKPIAIIAQVDGSGAPEARPNSNAFFPSVVESNRRKRTKISDGNPLIIRG